jgi:hypothetical protein
LTYFAGDDGRNELKSRVDALLRTCPDQSMRVQVRYEVNDQIGDTLSQYEEARRTTSAAALALDEERVKEWTQRARAGDFLKRSLAIYFIWNHDVHKRVMAASGGPRSHGAAPKQSFSVFTNSCITRERDQHQATLAQFQSILRGLESSMRSAEFEPVRMTDDEMFIEIQETIAPFSSNRASHRQFPLSTRYISAREQLMTTGIKGMTDSYLIIGDLLWSVITLKSLPEATYPGLIRELQTLGFPITISTNIELPNQAKVLAVYKNRHKKMLAAQVGAKGEFRLDMSAQVAAEDLSDIQKCIMGSTAKACNVSLTIAFRTSQPFATEQQVTAAEQQIADRREEILHVISRMEGAVGLAETGWAMVRTLVGTLPGQAERDLRDMEVLTAHAADLCPVEMPWAGTPRSPMMLFYTPYRQLLPFSPFDASLENANAIIAATSGTGKSMLVQKMLLMAGRQDVKVSILERGESYLNTVRYMGGKMITMSLDSPMTINPFDMDPGVTELQNDHRSFLVNLIRHMIGESAQSDAEILDSVIETSIKEAYGRARMRTEQPIPTLSDVRDELENYLDKNKNESVVREANIAAVKLRAWVDDGMYANLFDRQTTVDMNIPWLYFNIEKLKGDPKLETAMSLLIAYATTKRAEGGHGVKCITVLDECWALLQSKSLAPVIEQLFRTARKRGACVWGISQAVEDFTGTPQDPIKVGGAILTTTAIRMIGRQKGNMEVLSEFLHLSPSAVERIKNLGMTEKGKKSEFVIAIGEASQSTHSLYVELNPTEYWLATTYPREAQYRTWWLSTHPLLAFGDAIRSLAAKFPRGLAYLPDTPEERSGEVNRATAPPYSEYSMSLGRGDALGRNDSSMKAKRASRAEVTSAMFPELAQFSEVRE